MILTLGDRRPDVPADAFVAPDAVIAGRVTLGSQSSVWFGAVLRGDVEEIRIGARTNLQDQVIVHVSSKPHPTHIGDDVTVGHGAVLHGCRVGNRVLVGIRATVLDGAVLEDDCIIAAGSLVPPGMTVPSGKLVMGAPAQIARDLRDAEFAKLRSSAANYVMLAKNYAQAT